MVVVDDYDQQRLALLICAPAFSKSAELSFKNLNPLVKV